MCYILVRPLDMKLCIDIGAVSIDTLSVHLCVYNFDSQSM